MKYLKLFENSENKFYWLVNEKDYNIAAKKIEVFIKSKGLPIIRNLSDYLNGLINHRSKIFIGYRDDKPNRCWEWNDFDSGHDIWEEEGFKYLGEIEVTDMDIKADKFNL